MTVRHLQWAEALQGRVITWQWLVRAHAAEGHDEGVQTVALAPGVQLSQHDGMVGRLPDCTEIQAEREGRDRRGTFTLKGSFDLKSGKGGRKPIT